MRQENNILNSQQSAKLDDIARYVRDVGVTFRGQGARSPSKPFQPADIESLQNQMSQLSMAKADLAKEHTILKSLSFESRAIRYSLVPDAHHRTFEWVFEEERSYEGQSTGKLLSWLQEGSGVFWITGKPGSGKSTLMKFVINHPQTLSVLSSWSSPKPTYIANHFFWSAGTPMQKSWQGLLQALLYEIFRQLPDLIEATCTERWPNTIEQLTHNTWQPPELRRILQRVSNRKDLSAKFCFFIDGLDEFEGDYLEFCSVLHELSNSSHLKLCVSSRPWNVFEDSFGRDSSSKLYVNMFTRNDIQSFVECSLQEHPRWKELKNEVENAEWLINEITERAAGVFLWVFLTTRQLRNGLSEYDSFSDLRRRLESIPTDLEKFFTQILESVESFYHEKMATTLQMALAVRQPAPALIYSFHDEEYEDEEYALKATVQPLDESKAASMRTHVMRRLNGRCRGLLEVRNHNVEFLHRTVMDYLRSPEMSDYLGRKARARPHASLSLLRGFTAYIKGTKFPRFVDRKDFASYTNSEMMSVLKEALFHAKQLEGNPVAYKLLDELAYCIPQMHETEQAILNIWGNSSNPINLFFWEPVVEASLIGYLHHVLPNLPRYFPRFKARAEIIMIFALIISLVAWSKSQEQMEMLWNLLQKANHPNETYCDSFCTNLPDHAINVAWKWMLQKVIPSDLTVVKPGLLSNKTIDSAAWSLKWVFESGLFTLMLEHADLNAIVHEQPLHSSPAWMNFVLLSFCIPPHSSYQASYIQNLDRFIVAHANMPIQIWSSSSGRPRMQDMTGLNLFLHHLYQTSVRLHGRMNYQLLFEVFNRLLMMGRSTAPEIYRHWPILENAFPPQLIAHLRASFVVPLEMRSRYEAQKRLIENENDGGPSRKMAKYGGDDGALVPRPHTHPLLYDGNPFPSSTQ